MAKRYGIATPEDLERQERERRRKEAEYQALLMPEPGTAAWDKGLETSTPFFDILTGGVGGLGMKGIAKLGGLLGKKSGTGVLTQVPSGPTPPGTFEQGRRVFPWHQGLKTSAKPKADVFDLQRSPYDMHFDEFNDLSPALQTRLLRHHKIDPDDLLGHHYKSGGRERLVNLYEYSRMKGLTERAREFKSLLDDYDRRFGFNIETFRHPDESPFWWDQ